MKLYIAGPMTGYQDHNLPAFAAAAVELAEHNHEPINPGRHGADPTYTWADYLRRDLVDLVGADGVAVLPGWESSRGASLEVRTALALEMPVRTISGWTGTGWDRRVITAAPEPPTANEVGAWLRHNFGPDRSVRDQVLVVAEEVGELCRAIVKREQGIRGTREEWDAAVRKEAADIGIALLAVAHTEGFDLPTEMADVWAEVSRRDWAADPQTGRSA